MGESNTVKTKGLGGVHLPWTWNIPILLLALRRLLPLPFQGLRSVNVPCCPKLLISCVQARMSPSPSFPFPSPKENRTSNSLPLATYTHPALSSPRFLASADSFNSEEGGERRSDASPYIPAHVSGNCSQTPLPSILSTSTHNPSRPLVPSQSQTREP